MCDNGNSNTVSLTTKIAIQSYCRTLWLTVKHCLDKFSGLDGIHSLDTWTDRQSDSDIPYPSTICKFNDSWFLVAEDTGRLPTGGCRVWILMQRFYCNLDRQRLGLRMTVRLFHPSSSCVFPLPFYACLSQTYSGPFSLMSANCLGLKPPAAMTDGWFPPV